MLRITAAKIILLPNLGDLNTYHYMEQKLLNQVALVTGASSGIGAGVAKSMAAAGATVVLNYPVEAGKAAAGAVLQEITAAGGRGMTCQADVSREDQVVRMFQDVIKAYGTVDI